MDGQKSTYKICDQSEMGDVHISDSVLAVISAMAAMEVKGVVAMAGNITAELVAKLGMKKLSKGVRVDVDDNQIMIDLSIVIEMNVNILEVSQKVQDKVKSTLENMTGMEVANVNVNISSVASN